MHSIKYCCTSEDVMGAIVELKKSLELFLDIEGENLGRNGNVSLIQIYTGAADSPIYVFDILLVPNAPQLLRPLLESRDQIIYVWDPRADSDALYNLFDGIKMSRVICLQLAETAYGRQYGETRPYVHGLGRVLSENLPLASAEKAAALKSKGREMIMADTGVFNKRPLPEELLHYSANDVAFLPYLKKKIWGNLAPYWRSWVMKKSSERVELAWTARLMPQGFNAARSPR